MNRWVYPFFFFAMTLSAHYFFGAKQYYEGVLALVVIANVMMFMTWGLTKSTGKYYILFILITRRWTEIQPVTNFPIRMWFAYK